MGAAKKWPGGALQRAVRAGMDVEEGTEIHPECLSNHRQMQVTRLVRHHRVDRRRALVLAILAYGGDGE